MLRILLLHFHFSFFFFSIFHCKRYFDMWNCATPCKERWHWTDWTPKTIKNNLICNSILSFCEIASFFYFFRFHLQFFFFFFVNWQFIKLICSIGAVDVSTLEILFSSNSKFGCTYSLLGSYMGYQKCIQDFKCVLRMLDQLKKSKY